METRKLKWKDGVNPRDLQMIMRQSLLICDGVYKHYNKEVVVTCTGNGDHGPRSLHPWGYAYDIRTHFFTEDIKKCVYNDIAASFKKTNFQIVSEATHFHIEFDLSLILNQRIHGKI